jgi:hypothetical protein
MTTLNDLIETVRLALTSYTGLHEQVTWLTSPLTSTATTVAIAGGEQALRGIAEIDSELIYIHSSTTSALTLAPFGRGYRGTVAASHTTNAPVVFDPAFPRAEIKKAIVQAVAALYPMLYRVQLESLSVVPNQVGYPLPESADRVLSVQVQLAGDPAVNNWQPYDRWTFEHNSGVNTGKALNLYEGLPVGSTLRVAYASKFGLDDASPLTQSLPDVGLSESYMDLLTYAVSARMIRFLAPARLQLGSVENLGRAQVTQASEPGQLANQLYAMYQTRLSEERRRLLEVGPATSNYLPR